VYGLIERFSEDIDLVLDWRVLGFGEGLTDPFQDFGSKRKQDQFNKEMNRLAAAFIRQTLCPELDRQFRDEDLGMAAAVDADDPHVINVRYPVAFSESYIRPEVRLEIGPLASRVPSSAAIIRPYAYDVVPEIFQDPDCHVLAIDAERTFWEKATLLHQEAHRRTLIPQRYSRHYYDMYKLALSPVRDRALGQPDLLREVVAFKQRFYPSAWAKYEMAVAGTFRLIPAEPTQIDGLERDYVDMQLMLFGAPPRFDAIVDVLRQLELRINSSAASA
jgi:hypothetical protein